MQSNKATLKENEKREQEGKTKRSETYFIGAR